MFTVRAFYSGAQLGEFADITGSHDNQIDAEIAAEIAFAADAKKESGPEFDSVVVLKNFDEVVFEVEA